MKKSSVIKGCVVVSLWFGTVYPGAAAGSLAPPAGPITPTMKSLEEIEPRTPISSLPVTILRSGSYYLTTNLTGAAAQNGITITASDVTLDLNGFALIGVPNSLDGIVAAPLSGFLHRVVARNGVIRDWGGNGVDATRVVNGRFEGLRVTLNKLGGLRSGTASVVEDCTALGNEQGIEAGEGSVITRCTSSGTTEHGISTGPDCTISHCVCVGNVEFGLSAGAGTRVLQCIATSNEPCALLGIPPVQAVPSTASPGPACPRGFTGF